VIGVISVGRTARLLIFDEFPPVEAVRVRLLARFPEDSKWSKIMECPYCQAPYLAAGLFLWAWLSWDHETAMHVWWVANGIWAASYLAAILVAYDEPE
jgi:hypothetical protein